MSRQTKPKHNTCPSKTIYHNTIEAKPHSKTKLIINPISQNKFSFHISKFQNHPPKNTPLSYLVSPLSKHSTTTSKKKSLKINSTNDIESDYFETLVNKYHKSNLKRNIIIDRRGNNNLGIKNSHFIKGVKNIEKLILNNSNIVNTKSQNENLFINLKKMVVFDKASRNEIENTTSSNYYEQKNTNDTLSLEDSLISFSSFNENDKTIEETVPVTPLYSPRDLLRK